jgi:hypothetical protein
MKNEELRQRLIKRLQKLPAGTTMCPGTLARESGTVLSKIREDLLDLASDGEVRLTQQGKVVSPRRLKGPFRVSLPEVWRSKCV